MIWWGILAGFAGGLLLWALSDLYIPLFTSDPEVRQTLASIIVIAAVCQPLNGVVFVLDGVLIGAGDGTYLAVAGVIGLAGFAPMACSVLWFGGSVQARWWAFSGFMVIRFVTLVWRERTDAWLVTGAVR